MWFLMLPGQAYPVDGGVFAVEPKYDCEHINHLTIDESLFSDEKLSGYFSSHCEKCEEERENWVCLSCARILCSRYVNGHMKEHFMESGQQQHSVAISLLDLSLWCFICDSYVATLENSLVGRFHRIKFGESVPVGSNNNNNEAGPSCLHREDSDDSGDQALIERLQTAFHLEEDQADIYPSESHLPSVSSSAKSDIMSQRNNKKSLQLDSIESLASALKQGIFSNIVVLIGAGISTAAGIPDFRTPKTGLYDNLDKYSLPHPTAVFDIEFFRRNPQPFYKVAKELMPISPEPTFVSLHA